MTKRDLDAEFVILIRNLSSGWDVLELPVQQQTVDEARVMLERLSRTDTRRYQLINLLQCREDATLHV